MHCLTQNFDTNVYEMGSLKSNRHWFRIASGKGLVTRRRQILSWTNLPPTSPGRNKSYYCQYNCSQHLSYLYLQNSLALCAWLAFLSILFPNPSGLSHWHLDNHIIMMTSSNGNIFRVTGHLCGEFTGTRWIPAQRPVKRRFEVSLICAWINDWVNNREAGDERRHRAHYDVTAM